MLGELVAANSRRCHLKILENLNALLSRQENGEVSVRWKRLAMLTLLVAVVSCGAAFVQSILLSTQFRPLSCLAFMVVIVLTWLVLLYFAKRRIENKPLWQVSIRALLAGLTGFTIFLGISSLDRELLVRQHSIRAELESQLRSITGEGGLVSVSGNPGTISIGSIRPDFNDDDLRQILDAIANCPDANAPVTFLNLEKTQVSEFGAAQLVQLESLEHLFLGQTLVTDQSIDYVQKLENLKLISVDGTAVSDERLLRLSQLRTRLNIEPKSFQRLLKDKDAN